MSSGPTRSILKNPQPSYMARKKTTAKKVSVPQVNTNQNPTSPPAPANPNTNASKKSSPLSYAQVVTRDDPSLSSIVLQNTSSPLLEIVERQTWTPLAYKEVRMPDQWLNDSMEAGINRVLMRGAVIAVYGIMKGTKVLLKIWNPYNAEDGTRLQGQQATMFVVGFGEVGEALDKCQAEDIIEVTGSIQTRAYDKRVNLEGSTDSITIKTYDTSLYARTVTKYLPIASEESYVFPETQLHND